MDERQHVGMFGGGHVLGTLPVYANHGCRGNHRRDQTIDDVAARVG